ncbi:hypothetical protein FRC07_010508 [Ceratobasidium sp. 392]|nr:hypothetical protein FRC07_010508 [Ceratobasidium sp. 392]
MSQESSAAEQVLEPAGTGGEQSISNARTDDSKGKGEPEAMKREAEVKKTTTHSPDSPTSTQPEFPTHSSYSKPTMVNPPRPATVDSLRKIDALTKSTSGRTCSGNPGAPALSLDTNCGGVKVSICDAPSTEFFNSSSDCSNSGSDTNDAYSVMSGVPSLVSASTAPSSVASPVLAIVELPAYDQFNGLATQFGALTLADPVSLPSNPSMADSKDPTSDWSLAVQLALLNNNPTIEQALSGLQAAKWQAAMETKVTTLEEMGTYELVDLPAEHKEIGNKRVLTLKRDENVAQGFSQQPGIDFGQTFAPVVCLYSIRTIASLANHFDWDLRQLDVSSAYLHADVDEELYMKQIPYFHNGTNKVLRLKHSIYGLKQAGQMWNQLFDSKLKDLGFKQLKTDTCVYQRTVKVDSELYIAILAVHVNNIMVASSRNHTDFVINELLHVYEMRDLGPIRHFLGINFVRDHAAGLQSAYAAHTPMSPNVQLTQFEGTRPNFNYGMFIVTFLAQFTSCYGPAHVTAVKHVIWYLKGTPSRHQENKDFGEVGYSDANWGSSLLDRKSISGNVFTLGGAAITWSAKKQATVTLSTMEAEYMALSHACTQALWLRQFFEELHYDADAPTLLRSDNLAALTLSVKSQFHGQSKHIDIRHDFMCNIIDKRMVSTLYVPSKENLADAFTKALPAPQFIYLIKSIMGKPFATIVEVEEDE